MQLKNRYFVHLKNDMRALKNRYCVRLKISILHTLKKFRHCVHLKKLILRELKIYRYCVHLKISIFRTLKISILRSLNKLPAHKNIDIACA
jgi:hypothetical protein